MATSELCECAYCGATVEAVDPKTLDGAGWAREAAAHRAGCEWVATRAHTRVATIESLLESCVADAVAQGYAGEAAEYSYTAQDLDWVVSELGRKPTAAEWADAGLASVGGRHVAEDA